MPEASPDPNDQVKMIEFLHRELIRISLFTETVQDFNFLHVVPDKLYDGLTVAADGTNWNPGSGQGVYTYYNGGWHKLG